MKALVAMVLVTVAACSAPAGSAPTSTTDDGADDSAEMMAAAVRQLITENHTFGQGPPPFSEYLIQTHLDPPASAENGSSGASVRALTSAERAAIEAVVAPFGPVRWIDDPDEWRTEDLRPKVEGGVILGVGEPVIEDGTGLVPVSLWCGGLCGTWLTYRLEIIDEAWAVTGIEGPVVVS